MIPEAWIFYPLRDYGDNIASNWSNDKGNETDTQRKSKADKLNSD